MKMILAVMYREYRIRTTSLTWASFDMLMPLTYLLVFGIGLDKAFTGGIVAHGTNLSYHQFFLAGVLSMACFSIAINTSYGIFLDRDNGIFYEFLTYPMTRGEFLIGKILFNCLLTLVQTLITISAGVVLLDIVLQWEYIWIVLGGVIIGTAAWFFFMMIFALRIRRNDMYNTFINVAFFVFLFASSLFYPIDALPLWLRMVAMVNPMTWHAEVLRFATVEVGSLDVVFAQAIAFAIFLLASFWFAVRALRHAILR